MVPPARWVMELRSGLHFQLNCGREYSALRIAIASATTPLPAQALKNAKLITSSAVVTRPISLRPTHGSEDPSAPPDSEGPCTATSRRFGF